MSELVRVARGAKRSIGSIIALLALLWGLESIDYLFLNGGLDQYGIQPRSLEGLYGIFAAPFLHGGFGHLTSNTIGIAMLGTLLILWSDNEFVKVSLVSALVGGLGTWLVGGANSVHIGASGVVFGYFGYLQLRGWYQRSVLSIGISVAVGWLYGSLAFGMIPMFTAANISWEGHLFGFIGGALCARGWSASQKKATAEA